MEMLLGRGCRRRALSRPLVLGGSGDVGQIAAGKWNAANAMRDGTIPWVLHGYLLASQAQPCSGTTSRVEPAPVALCNANAIYMCYKSQEQIGQVA